MKNQEVSKERYFSLSNEIGKHNEIQSALKEAYELIKGVKVERDKSKGIPSKYKELNNMLNSFIKEYTDLENSIKDAVKHDKKISKEEKLQIMFELSDIVNLAENEGVSERKNFASVIGDLWKGTNTKDAKEKASDLRDKDIDDYSKEEAVAAMKYLSENYNNYSESKVNVSVLNNNIDSLDDKYEVRVFQDKLSKKIFGELKGFNNEYILGYNKEKGNYIEKINKFESNTQNLKITDVNSRLLANYLLYLNNKGKLNSNYIRNKFNEKFINDLNDILNKDNDYGVVKKLLKGNGVLNEIKNVLKLTKEEAEKIKNNLNPVLKEIDENIEKGNFELFLDNPEYISYIKEKSTFEKILELFHKKNLKIDLKFLNSEFNNNEYIFNEVIEINYFNLGYINKETLNNVENLNKLIKKDNVLHENLLMRAIGLKVDREIIKEVIKRNNIEITDTFYYIKVYIGEVQNDEKISKKDFDNTMEKINIDKLDKLDNVEKNDQNLITKYLIQNINNNNNITKIINLINKNFYGANGEFLYLPINNTIISEALVRKNPSMIVVIPKDHLGKENIINAFLTGGNRIKGELTPEEIETKINLIPFLDLTNINRMLQVFEHIINVQERTGKDNLVAKMLIDNPIFLSVITNNLENNMIGGIEEKYRKTFEKFKQFISSANLILYKTKLIDAKKGNDNLNGKLNDNDINKFKKGLNNNLVSWKSKGLDDKTINYINELINKESINGKNFDNIIKEITSKILSSKMDKQERENLLKDIVKFLENFEKEKVEKLIAEIDITKVGEEFKIVTEGKENLNNELIISKFNKFFDSKKEDLKGLKGNEKEKEIYLIKIQFIENYFKDLSKDDKTKILKILESNKIINDYTTIENNTSAYINYIKSGSNLNFEDYAKENKIELKNTEEVNTKDNINTNENNNNIITSNYKYDFESGVINTNNGDVIKVKSEDKDKLKIKENRENYISLYTTLKELNLSGLWEYIDKISNAIGTTTGIDYNSGFLNQKEQQKIINYILLSTGEKSLGDNFRNIEEYKGAYKNKYKFGITGNSKDDIMKKGDSNIEELFFSKYINNNIDFKANEFKRNIS